MTESISLCADFADRDDYRLVALDADGVRRLRDAVSRVSPRAPLLTLSGDAPLCLCDASRTHRVRRVEHSNTLLLSARRPLGGRCAFGAVSRVWEASHKHPSRRALEALRRAPLTLDACAHERDDGGRRYTFAQLRAFGGASAAELAAELRAAGAVVWFGAVRLIESALLLDCVRAARRFLVLGADWDDVSSHLSPAPFPPIVLRAVRAAFVAKDATGRLALSVGAVLRRLGGAGGDGPRDWETFRADWADWVADEDELLAHLRGAFVVRRVRPDSLLGATVCCAPQEGLSEDIAERVAQLFALHSGRWLAAELRAYVEPILDPGTSFEHVISRYAREHRVPNQTLTYSKLA